MRGKFKLIYNPYFHSLVLLWMMTAATLVSVFDQRQLFEAVNSRYTATGDRLMYAITFMGQPEVIIPVLLGLIALKRFRNWWYILTAIFCNMVPLGMQQIMKHFLGHPRPLRLYGHAAWIHFEKGLWPELTGNNSFPSGHSQGAFSFFCFLTLLLPTRYKPVGILFFFLALAVLYSRMYLAAHFFADVFAGSTVGVITTTLLFSVMHMYKEQLGGNKL